MSKGSSTNESDNNEESGQEKRILIPTIVVGDSHGCLHILSLDTDFRSSVEHAQKLKNESYFKQGRVGCRIMYIYI